MDHLPVPAHSLSRTLVQALHSADTRLLETCLLHSDEGLVLNTVRRLPPQLAVPLLTACVERLGRGAGANTGKGGGGGASAQRGTGLVKWVRAVLVVHTAHLMTVGGEGFVCSGSISDSRACSPRFRTSWDGYLVCTRHSRRVSRCEIHSWHSVAASTSSYHKLK